MFLDALHGARRSISLGISGGRESEGLHRITQMMQIMREFGIVAKQPSSLRQPPPNNPHVGISVNPQSLILGWLQYHRAILPY